MLAEDLRAAADRLTARTDAQYALLLEWSLVEFIEGEARREPLRARQISREPAAPARPR